MWWLFGAFHEDNGNPALKQLTFAACLVHANSFMGHSIYTFWLLNKYDNLKFEYIQKEIWKLIGLNTIHTLEILPTEAKLRQSMGKDQMVNCPQPACNQVAQVSWDVLPRRSASWVLTSPRGTDSFIHLQFTNNIPGHLLVWYKEHKHENEST